MSFLQRYQLNQYLPQKKLTTFAAIREQNYSESKQQMISRLFAGCGILCGMEITLKENSLSIAPGACIDEKGIITTILHEVLLGDITVLQGWNELQANFREYFLCVKTIQAKPDIPQVIANRSVYDDCLGGTFVDQPFFFLKTGFQQPNHEIWRDEVEVFTSAEYVVSAFVPCRVNPGEIFTIEFTLTTVKAVTEKIIVDIELTFSPNNSATGLYGNSRTNDVRFEVEQGTSSGKKLTETVFILAGDTPQEITVGLKSIVAGSVKEIQTQIAIVNEEIPLTIAKEYYTSRECCDENERSCTIGKVTVGNTFGKWRIQKVESLRLENTVYKTSLLFGLIQCSEHMLRPIVPIEIQQDGTTVVPITHAIDFRSGIHAASTQNGIVDVSPEAHRETHQADQADELNVEGLQGVLLTPQKVAVQDDGNRVVDAQTIDFRGKAFSVYEEDALDGSLQPMVSIEADREVATGGTVTIELKKLPGTLLRTGSRIIDTGLRSVDFCVSAGIVATTENNEEIVIYGSDIEYGAGIINVSPTILLCSDTGKVRFDVEFEGKKTIEMVSIRWSVHRAEYVEPPQLKSDTPFYFFLPVLSEFGRLYFPKGITAPQGYDLPVTVFPKQGYEVSEIKVIDRQGVDHIVIPETVNGDTFIVANVQDISRIQPIIKPRQYHITTNIPEKILVCQSHSTYIAHGEKYILKLSPPAGYTLMDVIKNGKSLGAISILEIGDVDEDLSINVVTQEVENFVRLHIEGRGYVEYDGNEPTENYYGKNLHFVPEEGYVISSLMENDKPLAVTDRYDATVVRGNKTIRVHFTQVQHSIVIEESAGGIISLSGSGVVNYGERRSVRISPLPDYHIRDVFINGLSIGATEFYDIGEVMSDIIISGVFEKDEYAVSVGIFLDGVKNNTLSKSLPYSAGTNVTLSFDPIDDYILDKLRVDTCAIQVSATVNIPAIREHHTICAFYVRKRFPVLASSNSYGDISPSGIIHVPANDTLTLVMTPIVTATLNRIIIDETQSIPPGRTYTFSHIDKPRSIYAEFVKDKALLSVHIRGNGTYVANPGDLLYPLTENISVKIIATPAAGWFFSRWVGDMKSTLSEISLVMDEDKELTAIFEPVPPHLVTLTTEVINKGIIEVNPAKDFYAIGEEVVLTARHGEGYTFDRWEIGTRVSNENPLTLSLDENKIVRAVFVEATCVIESSAGAHGEIVPAGRIEVQFGSDLEFSIKPHAGYHISGLVVDNSEVEQNERYLFTNIRKNHDIKVMFDIHTYTILSGAGMGGSISPVGSIMYNEGASGVYTITPDKGYHIHDVTVDSVSRGPVSDIEFTFIKADHTIVAEFAVDTFIITSTAGTGGAIQPQGTIEVPYSGSQTFTIIADAGYELDSVVVNGQNVGNVQTFTFTNVTRSHVIEARFKKIQPKTVKLSALTQGLGAIEVIPKETVYVLGSTVQLTAIPRKTTIFSGWTGDVPQGNAMVNPLNLIMDKNKIITALFKEKVKFKLNIDKEGSGEIIRIPNVVEFDQNAEATLKAVPASNWVFSGWSGDVPPGTAKESTITLIMDGTKNIVGHFIRPIFIVNAIAHEGGSISPAGKVEQEKGTTRTFYCKPLPGFTVSDVTLDGVSVGVVSSVQIKNIVKNYKLEVFFKRAIIAAPINNPGRIQPVIK